MARDETPRTVVRTQPDREQTEAEFYAVAERLLPQLTDAEWKTLCERLAQMRNRLREYEFDQRIGYFV
ncbi:hypothetical protein FJZ36_09950 [Candidatus Poribacteria bacterium]|nr:hypothetical protein [Candidatus Poribacteria bacterium]